MRAFLWCWCVLLFSVFLVAFSPLRYWQPVINTFLVDSELLVDKLEGRFWQGKANLHSPKLHDEMSMQCQIDSLHKPIRFQLDHSDFRTWGEIQPSTEQIIVDLDELRIDSKLANTALKQHGITVEGDEVIVESLYIQWSYAQKLPTQAEGKGYWNGGSISYPVGRHSRQVQFHPVDFNLTTKNSEPYFALLSKLGETYLRAKIKVDGEAEATVMPAFLNALGQPWFGDDSIPAFVMTEQLFQ